MVTAFYISTLSKKSKKFDIEDYYQDLLQNFVYLKTTDINRSRCRVCLEQSNESIFDNDNSTEFVEALQAFGGITIDVTDDLPKALCTYCYMFVKTAIVFKKKAKQTDAALKQHKYFKIETKYEVDVVQPQENDDNSNDVDRNDTEVDTWPAKDAVATVEIKLEKLEHEQENIKHAPKVTCRICGKIVKRSYYRDHLTMHDPNPHQWVCEVCGKSFRLRCAYHNHRLRHRNDFPHKCPLCPYKGRYKVLLKTHMHTHSGDYKYTCTECPARFLFQSNLNTHKLKHKEPQHKCDSCKRAFHSKLFLQRHIEADHLGIRNHACNICGKAFGYRNAMMKHQRRVHKREKSEFRRMPSYLAENKQQEKN